MAPHTLAPDDELAFERELDGGARDRSVHGIREAVASHLEEGRQGPVVVTCLKATAPSLVI